MLENEQQLDDASTLKETSEAAPSQAAGEPNQPALSAVEGDRVRPRRPGLKLVIAAVIFATALGLRLLFNYSVLEHRIVQFGDAYYFLNTGAGILRIVQQPDKLQQFIATSASAQTGMPGIQAMTSLNPVDRLLIDGPVFPSYLAMVQAAVGINPAQPDFDSHAREIATANAVLDSLSCVLVYLCGSLAFSNGAGLIAAVLMAVYPPAILNTATCYSEPFASFLLLSWLTALLWAFCRPPAQPPQRYALSLGIGALTGLLMLCKPSFVMLPLIAFGFLVASAAAGWLRPRPNPSPQSMLAFALGAAITLGPWLWFTGKATGSPTLFVNRVPAFNFFIGNDIRNDGWRVYPLDYVPGNIPEAATLLTKQFQQDPLATICLELRKVPRLWAGVWNTFQYEFPIPLEYQQLFHQMILFSAAIGFCAISAIAERLGIVRTVAATGIISLIVASHFTYLGFEPLSRYAMTAVPLLCLLAGYAWALALKQGANVLLKFLFVTSCAAAFLLFQMQYEKGIIGWLFPAAWALAAWLIIKWFRGHTKLAGRKVPIVTVIVFASLAALVTFAHLVSEPDRFAWRSPVEVSPGENRERINLPAKPPGSQARTAFILVDVQSIALLEPEMRVSLNGTPILSRPVPWLQVNADNSELLDALVLQTQAMGTTMHTLRQWWAIPFDAKLLKWNAENVIAINDAATPGHGRQVFWGDTWDSKTNPILPSFSKNSWTKGFCTIESGDIRLYERVKLESTSVTADRKVGPRFMLGKQIPDPKLDSGHYRIRLAICKTPETSSTMDSGSASAQSASGSAQSGSSQFPSKEPAAPLPPLTSSNPDDWVSITMPDMIKREVIGSEPPTYYALPEFKLADKVAPGTRFHFAMWLHGRKGSTGTGYISVEFSSIKDGQRRTWKSRWEPLFIRVRKSSYLYSFSDSIPAEIAEGSDVRVKTLVSPFHSDLLWLNRKLALKKRVWVDAATMELSPPLDLPALNQRKWLIF